MNVRLTGGEPSESGRLHRERSQRNEELARMQDKCLSYRF